jgi:hypothetical protein
VRVNADVRAAVRNSEELVRDYEELLLSSNVVYARYQLSRTRPPRRTAEAPRRVVDWLKAQHAA